MFNKTKLLSFSRIFLTEGSKNLSIGIKIIVIIFAKFPKVTTDINPITFHYSQFKEAKTVVAAKIDHKTMQVFEYLEEY